jgi:hypothetical protein
MRDTGRESAMIDTLQVSQRGGFGILDGDFDGALGGFEELSGALALIPRTQYCLSNFFLGFLSDSWNDYLRQRRLANFRLYASITPLFDLQTARKRREKQCDVIRIKTVIADPNAD